MGTETCSIGNVNLRPADGLLEKTHQIQMTDKTQFIAITHRRGTMEEADVLYGVTMQEKGVSKLLELQSAELAAKMKLDQE